MNKTYYIYSYLTFGKKRHHLRNNKSIFFVLIVFLLLFFVKKAIFTAVAESTPRTPQFGKHFRYVSDTSSTPMQIEVLDQESGQYSSKTVMGSDYVPVSSSDFVQILCGSMPNSTDLYGGEFYVYFYDQNRDLIWDILDYTDVLTGERNRVSVDYLKYLNGFQFTNIPTGCYVRIAPANGYNCQLLIWDGVKTGYPVAGLPVVFNASNFKERLPLSGTASIHVPDSAVYVIAKPEYTFLNMVISDSKTSKQVSSADCRFPSQILSLKGFEGDDHPKNIQICKNYDYATGQHAKETPNDDLSDAVVVIDENAFQTNVMTGSVINPIYKNIRDCLDFTWEAQADIADNFTNRTFGDIFRKGIRYHGIPYRSSWTVPSSVGWHISKQTFINAANDPDSIFYHTPDSANTGPYYSLVCSSFGTLVCGFSYPMTNFSLMADPQIQRKVTEAPLVGSLMTNGTGHCFIPVSDSFETGGTSILTIAEQIGPLTAIRNVYAEISDSWKGIGLKSSYTDPYIYCVSPGTFSKPPYDLSACTIKNGSARPYRGDQSVYTSAMDVLINIKDSDATRLYYQQFDVTCSFGLPVSVSACGDPQYMEIKPGTTQINLRSASSANNAYSGASLKNGAIYGVWASVGDQQDTAPSNVEFFEWYNLEDEKISYTVKNGTLITDDEFWYSIVAAKSNTGFFSTESQSGLLTIPYQSPVQGDGASPMHSDYSNYAERAQLSSPSSVKAFFRKGVFGAYVTGMEQLGS